MLILLSLPEQTSLDFTIKCVLPPAIHVFYMGKIIELVFPTLVITFLLTFIFCSLFRQISFTRYTLNIFSHTEQCYYKKKHISSTFETLKMQTSLAICFIILNTKKNFYLYNNEITWLQNFHVVIVLKLLEKTTIMSVVISVTYGFIKNVTI